MGTTEENNNRTLSDAKMESDQKDREEIYALLIPHAGINQIYMKILQEIYAYCVTEDTVSGMHLAQGKPHHAYQMNV